MPLYSCLNMGASILFVLNSELGSALLTLLERSTDKQCHRIHWIYTGIKLEIVEQGETGLSVVRLWEKRLPFLLSFPGFHFVFLDFFFTQLESSFIAHTSINEVISHKEVLATFSVFGHEENFLRNVFCFRNKQYTSSVFKLKGPHCFGNLFNQAFVLPLCFTFLCLGWKIRLWEILSFPVLGHLKIA